MSVVRLRSWEGNNLYTAAHRGAPARRARRTHIPIAGALLLAGALLGAAHDGAAQEAAPQSDLTPLPGAAEAGAAAARPAAVSTGDFVRMVVVLAAVLGAVYLLFLFIKRTARVRDGDGAGITLLGSRSLGGSRSLHLVQVGSGVYLVGATDQALNLIAQVTPADDGAAPAPDHAHRNGTGPRFSDLLAAAGAAPRAPGSRSPAAFLRHQQERLQRLRRRPQQEEDGAAD